MPQIILTEEQSDVVAKALEPVEVCDRNGRVLASIAPVWTQEDIAEAKRLLASPEPRYTAEEVHARLNALQEAWDREGGFDEKRMRELLGEFRSSRQP